LQEANPDGVPLLDAIANVLESRTPGVLGKRTLEAALLSVVNSNPRLAKVYCAVASAGASTLWELMCARDMGITSLDSYHLLRGASIMKVGLPPAKWLGSNVGRHRLGEVQFAGAARRRHWDFQNNFSEIRMEESATSEWEG
jgi:hypothetical protein